MGAMIKVLEGFHNWAASWIVGVKAQRNTSGDWEWSPVANAMDTAGIWPTKEYIQWIQSTIAVQVDCQPVYELCTGD